MKRLWLGVGLLTVMLLSGILVPELLETCHEAIVQDLDQAAELAMSEQWDSVRRLSDRAEENWEKKRPVTASFTDHEPLDEIDGLFAQLEVYAEAEESVAFSSTCVYLSSQLDALGDYHKFSFWNLF